LCFVWITNRIRSYANNDQTDKDQLQEAKAVRKGKVKLAEVVSRMFRCSVKKRAGIVVRERSSLAGDIGGSSSGGFHISSKLRNASFDPGYSRFDGYQG